MNGNGFKKVFWGIVLLIASNFCNYYFTKCTVEEESGSKETELINHYQGIAGHWEKYGNVLEEEIETLKRQQFKGIT